MKIVYADSKNGIRENVSLDEALELLRSAMQGQKRSLWMDFQEPTEDDMRRIADIVQLHPLTVRDILNPRVREKWSDYDSYLFVVGHGLNFNPGQDLLDTISVSSVVFPKVILSFHIQPLRTIGVVQNRITTECKGILPSEDWMLYAILDALTHLYMDVVDQCSDEIDLIDQDVLSGEDGDEVLARISQARRHLLRLRRRLGPKRDFLQLLCFQDHDRISRSTQILLRHVLDHVIRMEELADMGRETLGSAQSNYIAQVSNRMNAVMKTLSIVATVILPMTLVAALFGMNVQVPGQETKGELWFWVLVLTMGLLGSLMVVFFKRRAWL